MQLNGARILIECLIREGVNIIFGYPGGPYWTSMMNCPSTANSYATFWYVTSRPPFTPPTDTPALRARSASAWPHPAPEPPTR